MVDIKKMLTPNESKLVIQTLKLELAKQLNVTSVGQFKKPEYSDYAEVTAAPLAIIINKLEQ